ncbi:hypothetical protein Dform_01907 [Dehalogenimonas formicexedens]|uniref:Uncharacterized protein n=1 Tax=Dehalogenimonas formicexedens TaxID=1839801 RepID=A0A1P8F9V9_9CHLR|nr:hypothetical protein Dform_01907 [Dehalogenimonas formicexedens]
MPCGKLHASRAPRLTARLSTERVFSLVRHKYGLRSRKDYETLMVLFLKLAYDLILRPDLCQRLEKACVLKADSGLIG